MSASNPKRVVELTAEGPAGVQITILDGMFEEVRAGVGKVTANLAEGVYLVRWEAGGQTEEKAVRLRADETARAVVHGGVFNPVETPEDDAAARKAFLLRMAGMRARFTGARPVGENNAQLRVIVRANNVDSRSDVAQSVRVLLAGPAQAGEPCLEPAERLPETPGLGGVSYDLPDRSYRLQYQNSNRRQAEQTVYAFAGRRTMVLMEYGSQVAIRPQAEGDYLEKRVHGIEGAHTRVFSVPLDAAPVAVAEQERKATSLLQALAWNRCSLGVDETLQLVTTEEDPFIRLYAAAQLIRRIDASELKLSERFAVNRLRDDDLADRHDLVSALLAGVPPDNPDRVSLEQRLHARRATPRPAAALSAPPMLSTAWRAATAASVTHPGWLSGSPFFDAISRSHFDGGPWLIWNPKAGREAADNPAASVSTADLLGRTRELADVIGAVIEVQEKGGVKVFMPSSAKLAGLTDEARSLANAAVQVMGGGNGMIRSTWNPGIADVQMLARVAGAHATSLYAQLGRTVAELGALKRARHT